MKKPSKNFQIVDKKLVKYTGNDTIVTIPEGVEIICTNAFCNINAENIIFPDGLKIIEESAIVECIHLNTISLEDLHIDIQPNWYDECYSLDYLIIRKFALNIHNYKYYAEAKLDIRFVTELTEDNDEDFMGYSSQYLLENCRDYNKFNSIIKKLVKNQKEIIKYIKQLKSLLKVVKKNTNLKNNLNYILSLGNRILEIIEKINSSNDNDIINWLQDTLVLLNTICANTKYYIKEYNNKYPDTISEEDLKSIELALINISELLDKSLQHTYELLSLEDEALDLAQESLLNLISELDDYIDDFDDDDDDDDGFNNRSFLELFQ